jgi:hypothetical protein
MKETEKRPIDIHSNRSTKKGFSGLVETFLRTYRGLAFGGVTGAIVLFCLIVAGLATYPAMLFYAWTAEQVATWGFHQQLLAKAICIPFSYFIYGVTLIFIVPFFNWLNPFKVKPWRGSWFSLQSIPWFYHNALTYLVRFTFLDFVTPSPLNLLFFKMMGMKMGKGVMINTSFISDPCLIEIGDYATLGGSCTVFAHYGQKGILILAPVIIEKYVTVGLKASIMGDVVVGEGVVVAPHTVLLPKTRLSKERGLDSRNSEDTRAS